MLEATCPQAIRKVAIGSQLFGSCAWASVSVPAALAGDPAASAAARVAAGIERAQAHRLLSLGGGGPIVRRRRWPRRQARIAARKPFGCARKSGRRAARPGLAFALSPERTVNVFSAAARRRLEQACRVVDPVPLECFDDARARTVLEQTEILVTGWGCPPIDFSLFALAPRLRLVAHAAGTVKTFMAPEVFAGDVTVTHAAAPNALPVAEFTLAAIIFANKQIFRFQQDYARTRIGPELSRRRQSVAGQFSQRDRHRRRLPGRAAGDRAAAAVRFCGAAV